VTLTEIPSPWAQTYPRGVRPAAGGTPVPAGALRLLLSRKGSLELSYRGFCFDPWIPHEGRIVVEAGIVPEAGGLALCEVGGWADVRRILRGDPTGGYLTALDPFPEGREIVATERILGMVKECRTARGPVARAIALAFPLWSRLAALRYWMRKISEAPVFASSDADVSVQRKYDQQLGTHYLATSEHPGDERVAEPIRRRLAPGGLVLVCGSGVGREALHFARAGYRVTGFDVLPSMVEISCERARQTGLEVELFCADLMSLDLPGREFDIAYVTPLVYSFLHSRRRRIEMLRRLGRLLAPGGSVIFTAHIMKWPHDVVRALIVWARRETSAQGAHEFGDWYTWFLTPQGEIGFSFSHRFACARSVLTEIREAGFGRARRDPQGYFEAGDLR